MNKHGLTCGDGFWTGAAIVCLCWNLLYEHYWMAAALSVMLILGFKEQMDKG